jgi:hypothetical protein
MNTDVVILICRVNNRGCGWENCDWGRNDWRDDDRDRDRDHHDDMIVDSSSDPRIRRGTSCAVAIRRLLNAGFRLVDTDAVEDCGIKIVYTFVRRDERGHDRDRREDAVSPIESDRC